MTDPQLVQRLRRVGVAEGCTLLLLVGVAVPLKYLADWPTGVRLLGPVHGIAFVIYMVSALNAVAGGGFRPTEVLRVLLVALIPAGTFLNDPFLRRKQALSDMSATGGAS